MRAVLTLTALIWFVGSVARAESWTRFSSFIEGSDFIAQYQELTRDGQVVGTRLVEVYWEEEGFERPEHMVRWKPWRLEDYRGETDVLTTKFVFYGRGQHFWTAEPRGGVVQYPGSTSWTTVGGEVSCSSIEFHEILRQVGPLKREGKAIAGNLDLTVFGRAQKAE